MTEAWTFERRCSNYQGDRENLEYVAKEVLNTALHSLIQVHTGSSSFMEYHSCCVCAAVG